MCELCKKINTFKEILGSYFTDEEIEKMNAAAGLPGFNILGSRLSVAIMAVVEYCVDNGLSLDDIMDGVYTAYLRDAARRIFIERNPDSTHSVEERIKGFES